MENRLTDVSWDGIWDAQTRIDADGWVAEIEIPFKTVSFKPGSTSWGFNIERTIARYNEESRWASAVLDSTIHAVSRCGVIEGLEGLTQGIGLDVKPYGLLGVNKDVTRADQVKPAHQAGADAFYRITANLLSSTTINTDFAETEVDTRQVNLTRFPTLYPEKRAFFLEESGVFQFGLPSSSSSLIPFFSRRIGLVGGRTVPILVGEKLTGKVGRLEMGFLDVATRDSDADGRAAEIPGQNFVVGRVKYSLGGRQSYVGAIFTHGEPTGKTDGTLYGADMSIATDNFLGNRKNFDLTLYGLKTKTPGQDSRDYSYGAQVRYPNDRVNLSYSWQDIGENFDPKLGYVRRRGVAVNSALAQYRPRTQNNRYVRQATFSFGFDDYYNTQQRGTESRSYSVSPFGLLFHGGERLSYTVTHRVRATLRTLPHPRRHHDSDRRLLAPPSRRVPFGADEQGHLVQPQRRQRGVLQRQQRSDRREPDLEEELEPDHQRRVPQVLGPAGRGGLQHDAGPDQVESLLHPEDLADELRAVRHRFTEHRAAEPAPLDPEGRPGDVRRLQPSVAGRRARPVQDAHQRLPREGELYHPVLTRLRHSSEPTPVSIGYRPSFQPGPRDRSPLTESRRPTGTACRPRRQESCARRATRERRGSS